MTSAKRLPGNKSYLWAQKSLGSNQYSVIVERPVMVHDVAASLAQSTQVQVVSGWGIKVI